MEKFWQTLGEILTSKKHLMAIVGIISLVAGKVGFDADSELLIEIGGLFGALILAQGVADHGVSAAKIAANTQNTQIVTNNSMLGETKLESKTETTEPKS